jgi:sulfur carrier protein
MIPTFLMWGESSVAPGADPVSIRVNGEVLDVSATETVAGILRARGVQLEAVAVAVNGAVVPRSLLGARTLVAGDSVEVVRAVGGG